MLTQKIEQQTASSGFVFPEYRANCISNIPNAILQLLQAKKGANSPLTSRIEADMKNINKVVLLVVDGFGFNQFLNHHSQNPFLTSLTEAGNVFPLTSVYPSQTTNALTTLNTGLTPQEHGLFEYFIYLEQVGIVNALRFERILTKQKNLVEQGYDPKMMFSGENIQQKLVKQGIDAFTFMNEANAGNLCTKLVFDGSTIVPSCKNSDNIVKVRKQIEKTDGSAYYFVHLETLDTISHEYGPESEEFSAELQAISCLLQKELVERISKESAEETLLLLTADHGGVQVNPEQTTYLPADSKARLNAEVGSDHKRILPTGSPRDIFLHIKESKLTETMQLLRAEIGSKGQVIETKQAVDSGLFGLGKPREDFLERTGNLLIVPYGKETFWFEHRSGRRIELRGQHGGLSEDEMLVPFAAAKLSSLKRSN